LATRFQADKDMTIMPYFLGAYSNPTAYDYTRIKHGWLETKLICDATKPLPPATFPPTAKTPVEVFNRLTLQKLDVETADSELMRRLTTPT
jgi:2,5-furandicarboxylate decarboxylase 1